MTEEDREDVEPAAQPRRGRPVGDQDAKRKALLAAAMAVIAEHGYSGASLRKVAERAGHTTGAVTYYFENKEGMMAAVTRSLFEMFDPVSGAGAKRIDVRAGLKRSFYWAGDNESAWLALFQVLAHARHEPAFAGMVQKLYARFREHLTDAVARGQAEGSIRNDIAAEILADQISAISDGWMVMSPIEPERFRPARLEALLDATQKLIAPPAAPARPGRAKPR